MGAGSALVVSSGSVAFTGVASLGVFLGALIVGAVMMVVGAALRYLDVKSDRAHKRAVLEAFATHATEQLRATRPADYY